MTSPRMLGYGRQDINEADIAAVVSVLRGDFLTQGPAVEQFEAKLAELTGARFAIAVANGTAALHLAALAAGVASGKTGITQTLTFVASANATHYCGGTSLLVDVEPDTLSMDVGALRGLVTQTAPTIVVPVHFGGLAGDMAAISEAAGSALVIEDACHALGGHYADGRPVGCCAHSAMTVFSFHPVKPVTTGEGGVVTTNDSELARRLRLLRSHGIERESGRVDPVESQESSETKPWYYEQQSLGFNYRLSDMQAALGLSQLDRLGDFVRRRREIAAMYDQAFAGLSHVSLPQSAPEQRARSGHHLYLLHIDFAALGVTRTTIMKALRERGVGTQVHYIPVHHQPFHAEHLPAGQSFPVAEGHYQRCLSIPFYPAMDNEDVNRVVSAVKEVLS
jgi:UDP-4-amino-4,6-dideoxy-N-acetyl-beta-L-altrosamine transaminase